MNGDYVVSVSRDLCKGQACSLCQHVCPRGIWPLQETRPPACTGCLQCMRLCPEMAIDVAQASGARDGVESAP